MRFMPVNDPITIAARTSVNKRFIIAVLVGSLGGFVFGFDLGALSAATQSLRGDFGLSPWYFGFTISASIWGTVAGSIVAGRLADNLDRRDLMVWCALLYMAAAMGITIPVRSEWFLILAMRSLCGIAIGGFTVVCPLYLSEFSPNALRGRVVAVFQLQIGIGLLAAFSVGAACVRFTSPDVAWKWILGVGAVPASILLLAAPQLPILTDNSSAERDMHRGSETADLLRQRFFARKNTRPILLATGIAAFNQLSGVNVLLLYVLQILASAGLSFSLGHTYTILISSFGLATTILGMVFVDRLGRKPLLYVGSVGMAICLASLSLVIPHHVAPSIYLSILIAYNAFFGFSQGSVVWAYLSELFPPGLRGLGQGYGATVHWICNAVLIAIFPRVQHASPVEVFYVFAAMMVLQVVVVWVWYPETKRTALGSLTAARTS